MNPLRRNLTDSLIDRLAQTIELLRLSDLNHKSNEIPVHVLAVLLYIASHDDNGRGCHKQALEEDLPLVTRAGSSRNTDWLSKYHRQLMDDGTRKPGLGLIKKESDITDKRRSILTLTKKGKDLMAQVKQILFGSEETSFKGVEQKFDVKTKQNSLNGRLDKRLERLAAAMPGSSHETKEKSFNAGLVDELEKLIAMKDKGLLSDEEFTAAKAKILK